MTRWTASVALVLLLALSAAAGDGRPRLVLPERSFDFGTVDRGARIEHLFLVTNRGDAPLHIENVKSTCGCTVAVLSSRDVPPGGEGRVTVTLDTARLSGRTSKVVTLYTNDPDAPATGLGLGGQVVTDVVAVPSPLYLGKIRRGEPATREVLVTSGRPGEVYSVTAVDHANPSLRAALEPRGDGPGQRVVVSLAPDIPLGHFNDQLTLHTTSPREPVVTVAVFGSVEGDVIVLPPQVTFGVTRGGAAERDLFVRNRGTRPLVVTRVSVPADVATYELKTVEEGAEYRVTVRLRDGLPAGKVEGAIEIFTDHPDERRIVVPLYAIVRDGGRRG
jgi:hypothetical protein